MTSMKMVILEIFIINLDSFSSLLNRVYVNKFYGEMIALYMKSLNGLAVNIHVKWEQCTSDVLQPNSKLIKAIKDQP